MKISKDQDLVEKTLRLPRDLSEEIKQTAKAHDRSANAEMVERLRAAPVADEVARLASEITELKALVRQLLVSVG